MKKLFPIKKPLAKLTGTLAYFLKEKFNINFPHCFFDNEIETALCSNCENASKSLFLSKCYPDFPISSIPKNILKNLYLRSVGKCLNCELIQDYNRPKFNDLLTYLNNKDSKDDFVSEEIWHQFPMPDKEKKRIFDLYFKKRLLKWEDNLLIKSKPKKILFLRPTLGFVIDFFVKRFDAEIYFLEISKISKLEILNKFKNIKALNGNIHWIYYGDFTEMRNSFDLIISHHHLLHNFSIKHSLDILKKILSPNGQIIFTDEISVKYWNPFHYNFWDEKKFVSILKKYFSEVNKISDCGYNGDWFTTNYTVEGDSPDFICYK